MRFDSSSRPGHDAVVTALVASKDGQWVATASHDSTIILWDGHFAHISREWIAHDGHVNDLAFSPDSRYVASAGADGKVGIWHVTGQPRRVTTLEGHPQAPSVITCAWSPNGATIASRYYDGVVCIFDGRSFEQLLLLDQLRNDSPLGRRLRYSPDSRWLLVDGNEDCGMWDVTSGAYKALDVKAGNQDIDYVGWAASFDSTGVRVAIGYYSGAFRIFDVATAKELLFWRAYADGIGITSGVSFSPDNRLVLSCSVDKTVKIWDAQTGAMLQSLQGHEGTGFQTCFSPCGRYVASGSWDGTVRLWRTSDGSCLATLNPDHGSVSQVAFSRIPGGVRLWFATEKGIVLSHHLRDIIPEEYTS
ncbi:WD40 repeat-like protein [Dichomitus squalens LYAD-421 SS1]|uniref:WD40 repeat-like protein n=1 Tax=Dichomitus squalens (strain LYAD-421) TaxID=732165 RepID=UPI000441483F|nr:WD40 repeat-like protein [Dichomitus squalens LYAD-421 SS1]EJF64795.1 WD40 repeat-like protein [Dichomitus squalens LYAD-421 SS1]